MQGQTIAVSPSNQDMYLDRFVHLIVTFSTLNMPQLTSKNRDKNIYKNNKKYIIM